jgi:predicted nuclease of predicted toxin-antitoxin system
VRLLADTNLTALAVRVLREQGHDVVHTAERAVDPGDAAILSEAHASARVLLTKDNDVGTLVFRDGIAHSGVLLIDDLGSAEEEAKLLVETLRVLGTELDASGFVRAGKWGTRLAAGGEDA